MRVDELFPSETIDEDFKKWVGTGLAAGAMLLSPTAANKDAGKETASPSPIDISTLAQTMWGEARSHGPLGMLAVGFVIKNRAESPDKYQHKYKFGGHIIRAVAKQPKQFSCWNKNDPNHSEMDDMKKIDQIISSHVAPNNENFDKWLIKFKHSSSFIDYKAWRSAYKLANDILVGKAKDPTNGSVFYHTTAVRPLWAKAMTPVSKIQNHIFYRLPEKKSS